MASRSQRWTGVSRGGGSERRGSYQRSASARTAAGSAPEPKEREAASRSEARRRRSEETVRLPSRRRERATGTGGRRGGGETAGERTPRVPPRRTRSRRTSSCRRLIGRASRMPSVDRTGGPRPASWTRRNRTTAENTAEAQEESTGRRCGRFCRTAWGPGDPWLQDQERRGHRVVPSANERGPEGPEEAPSARGVVGRDGPPGGGMKPNGKGRSNSVARRSGGKEVVGDRRTRRRNRETARVDEGKDDTDDTGRQENRGMTRLTSAKRERAITPPPPCPRGCSKRAGTCPSSAPRSREASGSPLPPSWRRHGDAPRSAGPTGPALEAEPPPARSADTAGVPAPHGAGPPGESAGGCTIFAFGSTLPGIRHGDGSWPRGEARRTSGPRSAPAKRRPLSSSTRGSPVRPACPSRRTRRRSRGRSGP